ncbi:MAG: universal stress protein [Nitrososphaerota archaeon]
MQSIIQDRMQEIVNTGKILVYISGSKEDERLIDAAGEMAIESGASLVIMTVVKRVKRLPDEFIRFVGSERFSDPPEYLYHRYVGEAVIAPFTKRLQAMGVPYEVQIEVGDKKERIEAVAKAVKPYRIVIGMKDFKDWGFSLFNALGIQRPLNVDCPVTIIP